MLSAALYGASLLGVTPSEAAPVTLATSGG